DDRGLHLAVAPVDGARGAQDPSLAAILAYDRGEPRIAGRLARARATARSFAVLRAGQDGPPVLSDDLIGHQAGDPLHGRVPRHDAAVVAGHEDPVRGVLHDQLAQAV